jgi:hypothetical protein
MPVKFLVAHRRDVNNVGDMASMPLQYFMKPDQYQVVDVTDIHRQNFDHRLPMILGGGGLFGNDFMGDVAESVLTQPDRESLQALSAVTWQPHNSRYHDLGREFHDHLQDLVARTLERMPRDHGPRYVWGAGHNSDVSETKIKYSRHLSEYRMVGLRDWFGADSRTRWTPCASCMHPALQKTYTVTNDVIWFEHKKRLIKDFGDDSIPRFVNTGNNIEQTIALLGSANIVLTNSYHGAYWATLLRRKVIVVQPWSTKFRFMRFPPAQIADLRKSSWRDVAETAEIYPDALDLCRTATQQYWQDLQRNLSKPETPTDDSALPAADPRGQLALWDDIEAAS